MLHTHQPPCPPVCLCSRPCDLDLGVASVGSHSLDLAGSALPSLAADHHTLVKGENTLEAQIARVAIRSMTATAGAFSAPPFVQDFVQFMTTPGSHNVVLA